MYNGRKYSDSIEGDTLFEGVDDTLKRLLGHTVSEEAAHAVLERVGQFRQWKLADDYASNMESQTGRPHYIMHGEFPYYYVADEHDAIALIEMGYELAPLRLKGGWVREEEVLV